MNLIDLIVYLILLLAIWDGWRRGVILQVCALAGIVAGIWLASRFGATVGGWLRLDDSVAAAGGFVAVLVVTVIVVAVAARVLRKVFHFAGFGVPDIVLGVIVAALKYLLLLSVLFSAFGRLNADYSIVSRQTIEASRWYAPVSRVSDHVLPFLNWVGEQIPDKK